jgi:hypothetical protein
MNLPATGQTIAAPRPALSPTDLSIPGSKGTVVGLDRHRTLLPEAGA